MTSEDVQRWARVACYILLSGSLGAWLTKYGVTKEVAMNVAAILGTIAWSAFGMRINAKIAELSKYGEVKKIVANPIIANVDFADNAKVVAH
jgi:hypothetical protein